MSSLGFIQMANDYDLKSYLYDLPEELIAQIPAQPRDSSRMLIIHRAEKRWEHKLFKDLPQYLDENDVCVANNTQVIKARLIGSRVHKLGPPPQLGGRVEFVMLEELEPLVWEGLFHASARYQAGLQFLIPTPDGLGLNGILVRGSADSPSGTVVAKFDRDPIGSGAGELPLPHYIKKNLKETQSSSNVLEHEGLLSEKKSHEGPGIVSVPAGQSGKSQTQMNCEDEAHYQTIYAKCLGSAAAPTAGLHFSEKVREELKSKNIGWEELTLHVGLGTFRPVKKSDVRQHVMHAERYEIPPEVAGLLTQWKKNNKRIFAIGTTSVRALESAWIPSHLKSSFNPSRFPSSSELNPHLSGSFQKGLGQTSLFIYPGGRPFQVVDRLLTNFHLPGSTLLMLVCAFAGKDLVLSAYQDAVRQRYRFFSYGDCMLII